MLVQSHDGAVHLLPALPDDWKNGEIKGVRARGGFIVNIAWQRGAISQATVRSTIGGTLRLRSYVPLQGKGLKKATGACPNDLMAPATVKKSLLSPELKELQTIPLRTVYEYDLSTKPGGVYTLKIKN
jgi:alpha-L-fucosidase 2